MRFVFRFFLTTITIYLLIDSGYLPGVMLEHGLASLSIFTIILGLVNMTIGSILRLITFPIRWLSLGLIGSGISLIIVRLTDEFVPGVTLIGWFPVLIIALIMGVISMILG